MLAREEELWHKKSWAGWMEACDNNTKFFHHFVNAQKVNNTIWEIKDEGGICVKYFKDKAFTGVN